MDMDILTNHDLKAAAQDLKAFQEAKGIMKEKKKM